jgi:hypothetical protein
VFKAKGVVKKGINILLKILNLALLKMTNPEDIKLIRIVYD